MKNPLRSAPEPVSDTAAATRRAARRRARHRFTRGLRESLKNWIMILFLLALCAVVTHAALDFAQNRFAPAPAAAPRTAR